MATVYGDNYDVAVNYDPASDSRLGQGIWGGNVRVQFDKYTLNATATGTIIDVAKLPKGAMFIQAIIVNEALGSGVTLTYGDSGDVDRYLASTSAASAGTINCLATTGVGYSTTADTVLYLTTGGATTTSSDKVVYIMTMYSL